MTDALAVWHAHREFHQAAGAVPSKAAAKEIQAAMKAGHAGGDLIAVVQWAHLAPHDRAHFLRGPAYEAGTSGVGDYLGIADLFRRDKLDNRIAWAMEWIQAGRPDYRDAPSRSSGGRPAPFSLIEAFASDHAEDDGLAVFNSDDNIFKFPTLVAK